MSRRGHFAKIRKAPLYGLREADWPTADRAMWAAVLEPGGVLETGGRGARWKAKTIGNVESSYGHWLKWALARQENCSLGPLERVTRDAVGLYIAYMRARDLSGSTIQIHLQRLGQMMTAATETMEYGWLFRAANRLKPKSVRDKRAKIQPTYRLVELGRKLMDEAKLMPAGWHRCPAVQFRNGLLIALLAYRPVRLANVAAIKIGGHLRQVGDKYTLTFAADETKQNEELEFDVPAGLCADMSCYLENFRPVLVHRGPHVGTAGQSLWVSRDGGPLLNGGIASMVSLKTAAAFGESINVHLVRDCAATTIAIDDPEHAFFIAPILGHSSMATSEKHYNQARTIDAGRAYHRILAENRRALGRPARTRGTP
jgi:integrase/recombinase XerD